ncbi:hypothetical protein PR202_ga25578 [Eleusine coracana subsp. coracana]|uniref:RNA-binding S4 domain-containing protein n=1 Tax=Eleusine coracana subsp. coracana TaxID=191504 RepID=A0AAV5D9M5_ELECO|nr:hypothetical protein PR202_ga25578 [Eleusine coracana subsp. coracana]
MLRELLTLDEKNPRRIFEGEALLRRMNRYGLLGEGQNKLDYVLALTVENFLQRRLQTIVFKNGMAKSIHHARVLIRQRHIRPLHLPYCSTTLPKATTPLRLLHHLVFCEYEDRKEMILTHNHRYLHCMVFIFDRNSCRVGRQLVNIPSFMVRLDSEKHIDFSLTSPLGGGEPGRVKRKNQKKASGGGADGDEDEE